MDEKKILPDGTIPDMVFRNFYRTIVVELKKHAIDECAVDQLIHYLHEIVAKEKARDPEGILVGSAIHNPGKVNDRIAESGYHISIKLLGKDVPTIIWFCRKCRIATSVLRKSCNNGCNAGFFY